ncbi:FtsK/SpoIIIE domain-containing protein [Pseudonocardia xishanensis]|uniref:FtsK/SpoIIIE domain-containing protein n=1 Tax=Pseudonocardia xishanensis TaxID=630995 RepID=A0ABP8RUT5_9PSEU
MAPGRKAKRERVTAAFDAFHAAAARVLGAAGDLREEAVRRQAVAMVDLWLRREGIEAAARDPGLARTVRSPLLAPVVAQAQAERRAALAGWGDDSPRELARIVADHATGAAGDPGTAWLGDVPLPPHSGRTRSEERAKDGLDGFPSLWRIGSGRLQGGPEFPVAIPFLDEAHLRVDSVPDTRAQAEALVERLLMRVLSSFRPGVVRVDVWDGSQYSLFPALHPLSRTDMLVAHDPNRLDDLLEELAARIRQVNQRVLVAEGHASLAAHSAAQEKRRSEPWTVVVVAGNRTALPEEQQRRLQRIARSGLTCGIQLILLDLPITVAAPVETVRFTAQGVRASITGSEVEVLPDPELDRTELTSACTGIAAAHEQWRAMVQSFDDLVVSPEDRRRASSAGGLMTHIGFNDGNTVELRLDDSSPHALIGGPSGSGKTNLLLGMIGSLAARYRPDQLHFYLLDFKEGVSFAQFAPGRRNSSWLPHAKLIGINVNTDREFGLALLQFLADEMRRRADVAKAHEVTKLQELRGIDGQEDRWPRIVAVIDEFQYLFAENDQLAKRATNLLEDVARRGRSQGIHLVFASQDVSGIEAFWGRPAIFEQFVLRIALPRARRVLANLNDAALSLPRWHAVINHESGIKHANEIVRIPEAGAGSAVVEVQKQAFAEFPAERPRVFDGARSPALADLLEDLVSDVPLAVLGQVIDMDGNPASVRLPDAPGRNVAILGGSADAVRVLVAAALSLAATATAPGARFLVAPLVGEPEAVPSALRRALGDRGDAVTTVPLTEFRAAVEELAGEVRARAAGGDRSPVFLLVQGADAADPLLERSGTEALRTVVRFGPEVGVHVVGWWRSPMRLKQLLTMSASPDDVGAWIGLDVQGAELAPFASMTAISWAPRPGRGLFFDRSQHARPEVVLVPGPDATGEEPS